MSESYAQKVFTWHGHRFHLPEGPLRAFVLSSPTQMWEFIRLSNASMPPKVYSEIKSFLTQVYLIYLHEAELVFRMSREETKSKKLQWRSAGWSALEKLSIPNTQAVTSSSAKEIKESSGLQRGVPQHLLPNHQTAVGPSATDINEPAGSQRDIRQFLLPSSNLTLRYLKDQQSNVPITQDLTENNQLLQGQISNGGLCDSATTLSTTTQNLFLLDISAPLTAPTAPNPGLTKLGITKRFTNEVVNTHQESKKRTSTVADENSQKPNKKSRVETKPMPIIRLSTHPYNLRSSSPLPAVASLSRKSTTDRLANSEKGRKKAKHQPCKPLDYSLSKPVNHSLRMQQKTFSIGKDEMKSQRVSAMSSLKELVTEEGATFWLNYNLGAILERNPPSVPTGPSTLNAVEQTLPYLHSLKTRLVSLLHIAKDMHDARLGDWLEEEIGRAINDTGIAWDRLTLVTEDRGMKDKEMEDRDSTGGDVMEQAVQDEDMVNRSKGIQDYRDAEMEDGEVMEQHTKIFNGSDSVHGLMAADGRI